MNKYLIFNSLGSNYDWKFLAINLRQLIWPIDQRKKLKHALSKKYKANQVVLTRQGRDAIQLALQAAGVKSGDGVITQALTCYAIEEAIVRVGAIPIYVDIDDHLNLDYEKVKTAFSKNKKVKAIIVQHLLGIPAEIKKIVDWAEKNKVIVIEDLAQSMGVTSDGKEVGNWADLVVLSFGRDKMVDGVAGGAVLARTDYLLPTVTAVSEALLKEKLYAFIVSKARWGYRLGWGRLVFKLAKSLNFIWSPIESTGTVAARMPAFFASLVLYQFSRLNDLLAHRREIGSIYDQELDFGQNIKQVLDSKAINSASLQRYPLLVPEGKLLSLVAYLKGNGIFISDRWYRAAVDCGSENCKTVYKSGIAPKAEEISKQLLNLPTHQYITVNKARYLATHINNFFKEYEKH